MRLQRTCQRRTPLSLDVRLQKSIMPDKSTWQFINSFAPWLAALGTLLAVITSLYLARRDKRINISVNADIVTIIDNSNQTKCVCIEATNIGYRTANIVSIDWKIGIFRKRRMTQVLATNSISSKLPIKLNDGDTANYYFPIEDFHKNLKNFKKCFRTNFVGLETKFIFISALTSTGQIFKSRIKGVLQEWFLVNINRLDTSSNKY